LLYYVTGKRRKEPSMGSDAEVVLEAFRAIEERDGERLLELYHDEVQLHDPDSLPYGGTADGKPSLLEQMERAPETTWLGTWGPLQPTEAERRMDPRVISESDGEVVVEYRQRALSPSGERFDAPVVGIYRVRDGKFAGARMFHYDTAAINAFLARAHQEGRLP
jgi:ketosteroid isomerase-like protein